jgi:hypothetical protein
MLRQLLTEARAQAENSKPDVCASRRAPRSSRQWTKHGNFLDAIASFFGGCGRLRHENLNRIAAAGHTLRVVKSERLGWNHNRRRGHGRASNYLMHFDESQGVSPRKNVDSSFFAPHSCNTSVPATPPVRARSRWSPALSAVQGRDIGSDHENRWPVDARCEKPRSLLDNMTSLRNSRKLLTIN